ncbi:MAG: nuclear transport factor 2 family protein [Acidobacteria bacterium]|nr:nuclear transport factor 2 family protein [Acidobacteriota bacterium]
MSVALTALLMLAMAPAPPLEDPARVLDAWHLAAAQCDEARYFGLMTEDAVFLGTDPGERWGREEFRTWAAPYFKRGKAWTFKATRRSVAYSRDGKVSWFEEDLATPNLGPARGSGVLVKSGKEWRIVQYNLSVPIPNGVFKDVKLLIEQSAGKK